MISNRLATPLLLIIFLQPFDTAQISIYSPFSRVFSVSSPAVCNQPKAIATALCRAPFGNHALPKPNSVLHKQKNKKSSLKKCTPLIEYQTEHTFLHKNRPCTGGPSRCMAKSKKEFKEYGKESAANPPADACDILYFLTITI